jgi:hypothetical protein
MVWAPKYRKISGSSSLLSEGDIQCRLDITLNMLLLGAFKITNVFCDIITRHKYRLCVRHKSACDVVICEGQFWKMSKTNLHKQQKHCHKKSQKSQKIITSKIIRWVSSQCFLPSFLFCSNLLDSGIFNF